MGKHSPKPDEDIGREYWQRLVRDERSYSADFAKHYLEPLAAALHRRNPQSDPHDCLQAAMEAVLELINAPHRYNPERSSLMGYLLMAAKRDLQNIWRCEQRHHRGRVAWPDEQELPAPESNRLSEPLLPAGLLESWSPQERAVWELMGEGVRDTREFARVLCLENVSELDQRAAVKRMKDRVIKRARRAVEGNRDAA